MKGLRTALWITFQVKPVKKMETFICKFQNVVIECYQKAVKIAENLLIQSLKVAGHVLNTCICRSCLARVAT